MVAITFITPDGDKQTINAEPGQTVMEAAISADIDGILADCGGSMVCGTCHAFVPPQWQCQLPEQSDMEVELLDYVPEPAPNGRLTCQITVTDALEGITFQLPACQR